MRLSLKFLKVCLLVILLRFAESEATEYQPWIGPYFEFEWRNSTFYQGYTWVSSGSHLKKYASNDVFLQTSLTNALKPELAVEVEALGAKTRQQNEYLDSLKITGRYVWFDDVAGDSLTLTTGLSADFAFKYSLRDISSFHHGKNELEVFLSIGKEYSLETAWVSRWWGMVGVGGAIATGSPWLHFYFAYEKRLFDQQEVKLFASSLWGLGHQRLCIDEFRGYGSVKHQSIDLGIRYVYLLEYFGSVSLEYAYRVYTRNFPFSTHCILAQILYKFGI